MNYWDGFKHLELHSLQRRREQYQIIYVWKIIEDYVPNIGLILGQQRTC